MLDRSQWIAIGLVSGFAYILGKDRESFNAEEYVKLGKDKWSLFSLKDGSEDIKTSDIITNKFNNEMDKTLKKVKEGADPNTEAQKLFKKMEKFMDKYENRGASDTEPHETLAYFIEDVFDEKGYKNVEVNRFLAESFEAETFEADVESVVSELRELGMPQIIFEDDEERIKINGELVYKMEATPMPIRDGIYSQPLFYIGSKHDEFGRYINHPLQDFSPPIWIRTPKGLIKNIFLWNLHKNKILERKIQRRLQENYGEYAKKNPFECLCGKRFKNENSLKKHQRDKKHPNYHPSHTLFDNELKGPPINSIRNPDGITLKEVYLMFPNWDGNYVTWEGKSKKPLKRGFNYFNAESFEAEKKNCGCGQDPCVTYGAENFDWSKMKQHADKGILGVYFIPKTPQTHSEMASMIEEYFGITGSFPSQNHFHFITSDGYDIIPAMEHYKPSSINDEGYDEPVFHIRKQDNERSWEADGDNFAEIENLLDSNDDIFLGTGDGFKPDHPNREEIIAYLTQGGGGQTPYRVCFTCSRVTPDWVTIDEGYECIPCADQ